MQELSRYAVGLDVGTTTIRCVVGHVDNGAQTPTIIASSAVPNSGMRKGMVVNLAGTAQAIDAALEEAERTSGHQIHGATFSINGPHIVGMSSKGVVAVGTTGHEINQDDLDRVIDAATVLQLPANRVILDVTPRSYQLDDQANIKDPVGMTGVRLEVDAHVITALAPHVKNLHKAAEMTKTDIHHTAVPALAAAHAVLSDQQKENGVVLVDIGGSTTNVAVYEEGDLQHVAVIPMGGINITNDLAIGLKTDLDIAEELKLKHGNAAQASQKSSDKKVSVSLNKQTYDFDAEDIEMIIEARLEEIFELVNKELKSIGKAAKLPGGVVLSGGSSQLASIDEYAKEALQLPARLGKAAGFSGVADKVKDPSFATALGLMMMDLEGISRTGSAHHGTPNKSSGGALQNITQSLTGVIGRFRS